MPRWPWVSYVDTLALAVPPLAGLAADVAGLVSGMLVYVAVAGTIPLLLTLESRSRLSAAA